MRADKVFWTQLSSTRRFIDEITAAVFDEKSVLINLINPAPWYEAMQDEIQQAVSREDAARMLETIEDINDVQPGDQIISQFCSRQIQFLRRPSVSHAKFLSEQDSIELHTRCIWVTGITPSHVEAWVDFVTEYYRCREKKADKAVFIMVTTEAELPIKRRGICYASLSEAIGIYDCYLFSMLLQSDTKNRESAYLADLVSGTVGDDFELAALCMEQHQAFLTNPLETLKNITAEHARSDGNDFILRHAENEFERCIWKTQIRQFFPIIEEFRKQFASNHTDEIMKQLPVDNGFHEMINNIDDVEIRTLLYLASNRKIHINRDEMEQLGALKSMRDKLAHGRILSHSEVQLILE